MKRTSLFAATAAIAVGKDADLVIYNGPWYEPKSRVDLVIGDGQVIYDRTKEAK